MVITYIRTYEKKARYAKKPRLIIKSNNDNNNLFVRDILTPASEKRHLYITRRLNTDLLPKTVERWLSNVRVHVRGGGGGERQRKRERRGGEREEKAEG